MHRVLSRQQIRELDRYAIEQCRVPGLVLMENAGAGAARIIRRALASEACVIVVCGTGNNGGDGFVVARHLLAETASVKACLLGSVNKLTGDARSNYDSFVGLGGQVLLVDGTQDNWQASFADALAHATVLVDAVFGTGLEREIVHWRARAINLMNETSATKIALDLPSGLDADTGHVWGTCFVAHETVTFGALKLGLLTPQGGRTAGNVHVVSLGVPTFLLNHTGYSAQVMRESELQSTVAALGSRHGAAPKTIGIVTDHQSDPRIVSLALRAAFRAGDATIKLIASRGVYAQLDQIAADVAWCELAFPCDTHDAWSDCDALVFPAVDSTTATFVQRARAEFDGLIVLGLETQDNEALQPLRECLSTAHDNTVIVGGRESLLALANLTDTSAVPCSRFALIRNVSQRTGAVVLLADEQPTIATSADIEVWGEVVERMNAKTTRAVCCGAIGQVGCWTSGFDAARTGLFLTAQATRRAQRCAGKLKQQDTGLATRRGGVFSYQIADCLEALG